MTCRCLARRYQKSIAMLIMTALLASMASAAGEAASPAHDCVPLAPLHSR